MKPIVLCIMDGFGMRTETHGNAIKAANKPNFDYLWTHYPHSFLNASGTAVGLPEGQMGNSEVGHCNIGAGRIVYQPLQIISNAITDGSFFNNGEILKVIDHVKNNDSKLHIFGLLSDGGVHSHIDHIFALLEMAKKQNITNLYFHMFLDGRDTKPDVALNYVEQLEHEIKQKQLGVIATLSGRFYSMDRDHNYDRVKSAYDAIVNGIGERYNTSSEAVSANHHKGIYDEFIIPCVIDEKGIVEDNDGIIFANFRTDRATELMSAITNNEFKEFETKPLPNVKLVSLMPCNHLVIGMHAFEILKLENTLGEYIANLGYKQLRIAETEKYAHVTFFFDGLRELTLAGCDQVLIPSPKVTTYDLKPEMSANEITTELLKRIDSDIYDLIILNFANCDMVGHTGSIPATIKAVETVDYCLGQVYNKIKDQGLLIVTADHGNAEYKLDDNDNVLTAHTTNPVPFIICDEGYDVKDGKLGDIAPTIIKIMNKDIPDEMTGEVLISKK